MECESIIVKKEYVSIIFLSKQDASQKTISNEMPPEIAIQMNFRDRTLFAFEPGKKYLISIDGQ